MALSNPYEIESRILGRVGHPLPGVEVRIVDSSDDSRILATGTCEGTDVYAHEDVVTGDLQVRCVA